jgi:energy-coupling factor transporter ATP-binding protein EcfA2
MRPIITDLSISGFRALRELNINGLGRVNLVTGRNNTGKSSLLEALRILASDVSPSVLYDILRFREEDARDTEDPARLADSEILFPVSSLFYGFPSFSDDLKPIKIETTGNSRPIRLSIGAGRLYEERDQNGTRRRIPVQPYLSDEFADDNVAFPALFIETNKIQRFMPLDLLSRYTRGRSSGVLTNEPRMTCIAVNPYGGERTATLGALWDKIALSDHEDDIIKALQIIDPEIVAVSMIGGEGGRLQRTAIVRASNLQRPVPLRSYGDGVNRLFGIVLSQVNAKDGLLLIDEFENGMHYSIQRDTWRIVFDLANRLNIQVVATSHSWDTIEAFQHVANEHAEDGVLIRLSRRDEEIIPTLFREDELAIATRDRIEVR